MASLPAMNSIPPSALTAITGLDPESLSKVIAGVISGNSPAIGAAVRSYVCSTVPLEEYAREPFGDSAAANAVEPAGGMLPSTWKFESRMRTPPRSMRVALRSRTGLGEPKAMSGPWDRVPVEALYE